MDLTQIQFLATNPHRYGDGSFKFEVVLILPPTLAGQSSQIVATANIHVNTDQACIALGRALIQIGEQLPPELAKAS